jgi:transcriptional regulator with XRE-family HTH domain
MSQIPRSPAQFKSLISFIDARQTELNMDDAALSSALGYESESVVLQIKQKNIRFPISKLAALATALDVSAVELMKLHLSESDPLLLEALNDVLLSNALNPTEVKLIKAIRKMTNGRKTTPLLFDGSAVVAMLVA